MRTTKKALNIEKEQKRRAANHHSRQKNNKKEESFMQQSLVTNITLKRIAKDSTDVQITHGSHAKLAKDELIVRPGLRILP